MNLTHLSSGSPDQVFQFPSNCLKRVVAKYCKDNLTVPNIVHYIWFGSLSFEFMHFVSFLSAYKYQNPCMILFFHDMLPSGIWWNLLRQTVPNVVLVRVTPPTHISGRKIKFIQHKADIFRLQILKGIICRQILTITAIVHFPHMLLVSTTIHRSCACICMYTSICVIEAFNAYYWTSPVL